MRYPCAGFDGEEEVAASDINSIIGQETSDIFNCIHLGKYSIVELVSL